MNNQKIHRNASADGVRAGCLLRRGRSFLRVLAMALPALLPGASLAYQLEDIGLTSDASQTSLRIAFSKGAGGEGDYPLYFQKADPDRGTLTLSFLDTETSFPLGRHGVDQANPLVEEILL
ncbi:MAG TPA: hypothetical protein VK465_16395, partial [Fibrobacteria bacterium]|nr:hypothetical protein [Fibrobacteria bacterium]